jgi:hypothetical protein
MLVIRPVVVAGPVDAINVFFYFSSLCFGKSGLGWKIPAD